MSYRKFKYETHGIKQSIFRFESKECYYSLKFDYDSQALTAEIVSKGKTCSIKVEGNLINELRALVPPGSLARAMANAIRMTRAS